MAKKASRKAGTKSATASAAKPGKTQGKAGSRHRVAPPAASDSARVDAYIEESADFAKPVLRHLRKLFHQACPQVEEKIKWGVPYFEYRGMLGGMAAFKQHVSFGFWNARQLNDTHGLFQGDPKDSMCSVKARTVAELPTDKVLLSYIRQAVALNEAGVKKARPKSAAKPPLKVPADFQAALTKSRKAAATFEGFSPSHRREYIEWITEAKRDETRQKRLATATEWIAEGKPRNWKYM